MWEVGGGLGQAAALSNRLFGVQNPHPGPPPRGGSLVGCKTRASGAWLAVDKIYKPQATSYKPQATGLFSASPYGGGGRRPEGGCWSGGGEWDVGGGCGQVNHAQYVVRDA